MALKFFSRLFGTEAEVSPEAEEAAAPPPVKEPERPAPVELRLTADHGLNKLWRLYCDQSGVYPPPVLALQGPAGEEVMARASAEREVGRLRMAVTTIASKRLSAAFPKKPKEKTKQTEKGKENAPPPEPPPPPCLDAAVQVYLAQDQLTAWLLVYPPVGGGAHADRKALSDALENSGVTYGVDNALLDNLPDNPELYFHLWLAARGQAAENGRDGQVVDLFPRKIERSIKMDQFGRVDYTSLDIVHNVEENGVICRIIPPTPGIPGRTVQDKEAPAKDGRAVTVPQGRNTYISEDGTALLASQAGHVEFERTFQVRPVLEIGGRVDYSTGNINFLGDVHIAGDVCAGFTVKARGNITIDGVVEACTIEAGGDLVVAKGVVGNEQAVLRANRSIFAKFLENCFASARESLQADCIINSDVYCNGSVLVQTGRSSIVGGRIFAACLVSAGTIGSRSELPTLITLGGQPCEDFEGELLRREIRQLEKELEEVEQQPASSVRLSKLSTIRLKLSVNRQKLGQLDKTQEQMQNQEQPPGRLKCEEAYAGTEITINGVATRLTRQIAPCNASLVGGEICLS